MYYHPAFIVASTTVHLVRVDSALLCNTPVWLYQTLLRHIELHVAV